MPDDSSRNPEAFVQLMTEHQGRLYAYVLSLLGIRIRPTMCCRRRIWFCGAMPVSSRWARISGLGRFGLPIFR